MKLDMSKKKLIKEVIEAMLESELGTGAITVQPNYSDEQLEIYAMAVCSYCNSLFGNIQRMYEEESINKEQFSCGLKYIAENRGNWKRWGIVNHAGMFLEMGLTTDMQKIYGI